MSYRRVTLEDPIKIKLFLQQGKTNTEIANLIGKNKSIIDRETNVKVAVAATVQSRRRVLWRSVRI